MKTPMGQFYAAIFKRPNLEAAADRAREAASQNGINGHAAALRWTLYHSGLDAEKGDAVVIGSSSIDQLKSNLDIIDAGPLPQEVADALGAVYGQVGDEVIPYHF